MATEHIETNTIFGPDPGINNKHSHWGQVLTVFLLCCGVLIFFF